MMEIKLKFVVLLLTVLLTLPGRSDSLNCYSCTGFNPDIVEGPLNNRYCSDGHFDSNRVNVMGPPNYYGTACVKIEQYRIGDYELTLRALTNGNRNADSQYFQFLNSTVSQTRRKVLELKNSTSKSSQNYPVVNYCYTDFCNGAPISKLSSAVGVWMLVLCVAYGSITVYDWN